MPGQPCDTVDTPAAFVDLDKVEDNIRAAVAIVNRVTPPGATVTIRPHVKAHKCMPLALLQISLSNGLTTGVCCQKVIEAECAVAGGVMDVLVSNQVISPEKLRRLAALAAAGASVGVLVDCNEGADALSRAAVDGGVTIRTLVEVDVGQRRCGVEPQSALALGQYVASLPGLRLDGIQCYHGGAQHIRSVSGRAAVVDGVVAIARATRDAFLAAGLPCGTVTGGGTGTFWMEAASGVFTEVQPGSYVLGDADYARNEHDPACALERHGSVESAAVSSISAGEGIPAAPRLCWGAPFQPALFLLTQVMSRRVSSVLPPPTTAPQPVMHSSPPGVACPDGAIVDGWVVVDSGLKAQSTDSGPGVAAATLEEYVHTLRGKLSFDESLGQYASSVGHLAVRSVSDEHSTLAPDRSPQRPESAYPASGVDAILPTIGTRLLIVPGHCDPFVNHFDWLVGVRGGVVEAVWRVAARSPGV